MLHLKDEQLIAVQLLASEPIRYVSFDAIQGDRKRWEIEDGFARVPYHLTLPLRRSLQIVLLQVDGKWPSSELALHQCAGYILNVDLKITPVPAD
jgi:hypothetical protein